MTRDELLAIMAGLQAHGCKADDLDVKTLLYRLQPPSIHSRRSIPVAYTPAVKLTLHAIPFSALRAAEASPYLAGIQHSLFRASFGEHCQDRRVPYLLSSVFHVSVFCLSSVSPLSFTCLRRVLPRSQTGWSEAGA